MKKSLFTLFMIIVGLSSLTASAETRVLNISQPFSSLDTSGGVKVIYQPTTGSQRTVKIEGVADRIDKVEVRISGNTLKISPKRDSLGNRSGNRIKGVIVTVTAPLVNDIEASSGSSVNCKSASANGKKMEIDASSGASVSVQNISCRKLEAEASSGASIKLLSVTADKISLDASSGANISAQKVTAKDSDCEASSGASINIAGTSTKGSFTASSGGAINGASFSVKESRVSKSIGGAIKLSSRK